MALVFCYGTLKKGYRNHRVLGGSKFVTTAKTATPHFKLYDNGSYPCLKRIAKSTDEGVQVEGEVYEVTDEKILRSLDYLEGYDSDNPEDGLYRKEVIPLVTPEGEKEATVYIYNGSVSRFLDCGSSWPRK